MRSFSILSEAIDDFERAPALAGESVPEQIKAIPVDEADASVEETAVESVPQEPAPQPRPDMSRLEFDVTARKSPDGKSMVLDISGAIDAATSAAFEDRLEIAIVDKPRFLVLDLAGVIYISSSGWGVIVKYMQRTGAAGGKMALSGMKQPIFKIFRDLGFEPLIPHFMSSGAALAELSAPAAESPVEKPVRKPVEEVKSAPPVDSFRSDPLPEKVSAPELEKSGVEPIETAIPEKAVKLDVKLDLSGKKGEVEDKDEKIRKLGWGEYGRKLFERNSRKNGKKK
jgi:anti-anti-sigma factor